MSRAELLLRERVVEMVDHPFSTIAKEWTAQVGVPPWRVAQRAGVDPRQLQRWLSGRVEPRRGTMLAVLRALAEIQAEQEDLSKARELSPRQLAEVVRPKFAPQRAPLKPAAQAA